MPALGFARELAGEFDVERSSPPLVADAAAVGEIGDEEPAPLRHGGEVQLERVASRKGNVVYHPGPLGVGARGVEPACVPIVGDERHGRAGECGRFPFAPQALPLARLEESRLLESEGAVPSGSEVARDECRLDDQRACAAHGVEDEVETVGVAC